MYIYSYPNLFHHIIYVKLTFPFQSDIDIPRNNFRAGAVVQYNGFLRMCEGTTVTHHGYVSLSLIYITSESSIFREFHTILWSKINTKFRLQVSPVQNLQRSSTPRCSVSHRSDICGLCGKFLFGITRIQGQTENAFTSYKQQTSFPVPKVCPSRTS